MTIPMPDMIDLKDVKAWMIDKRPGHICMWSKSGWTLSACGTWTPNGEVTEKRPKRICKACRDMLPKLKKTEPA